METLRKGDEVVGYLQRPYLLGKSIEWKLLVYPAAVHDRP